MHWTYMVSRSLGLTQLTPCGVKVTQKLGEQKQHVIWFAEVGGAQRGSEDEDSSREAYLRFLN